MGLIKQTAPEVVFQTRGLTKVYDMGEIRIHALRGIDLELHGGELVVLLGASGSGKSTLVNILGGLDTATDGQVLYRGKDLTRADDHELTQYRRHHVDFVFQFYNLILSLTARENVEIVTDLTAFLHRIDFEQGDIVQEGQPLVELEAPRSSILDSRSRAESIARVQAAEAARASVDAANADLATAAWWAH